jgi:hypothetical protein
MARAQIEVEINEVKRIAVPTSGLACKHRLRKDPAAELVFEAIPL